MKTTYNSIIITILVSLFVCWSSFSVAQAQTETSYIAVHAHNSEGVEIASIQGMIHQKSVEIYDGNDLIGYGAYNAATHNQPIPINAGSHTIKVKFNGMTEEQTMMLEEGEMAVFTFAFERTDFDLVGFLKAISCDSQARINGSFDTTGQPADTWITFFDSQYNPDRGLGPYVSFSMQGAVTGFVDSEATVVYQPADTGIHWETYAKQSYQYTGDVRYFSGAYALALVNHSPPPFCVPSLRLLPIHIPYYSGFGIWFVQCIKSEVQLPDLHQIGFRVCKRDESTLYQGELLPTGIGYIMAPIDVTAAAAIQYVTIEFPRQLFINQEGESKAWGTVSNVKMSSVPYDLTGTGVKDGEKQPPVASFTYSPVESTIGEKITLDGSTSHDPDGTIVSYQWDFGDGNTASGQAVAHTYSEPGEYTITLEVTDNDGLTNSISKEIKVGEIGIVRVDADHNIKIRDENGLFITNPIWTISEAETVKPIADVRGSDFLFNVKIRANPKPDWYPRVIGRLVFYRHDDWQRNEPEAHQYVTGRVLYTDDPDGWIVELRSIAPTRVGKYTLDATFIVLGEDTKELDRKNIDIPFYVVFHEPKESLPLYPVKEPSLLWLDTACEWGRGAASWIDVPVSVMAREYSAGKSLKWVYGDPDPNTKMGDWYLYIDPKGRKVGNCWNWSDVWVAMVRILGVPGYFDHYERDFLTKQGFTALAPTNEGCRSKTGNIVPRGSSDCDRWHFISHCVGLINQPNKIYYDPTFRKFHTELQDAVFCKRVGWEWEDDYGRYRKYVNLAGCDYKLYYQKKPREYESLCPAHGTISFGSRPLDSRDYRYTSDAPNGFSDYGLDTNGDGLYDYLVALVTIDVNEPGTYQIFPELALDEDTILPGDTLLGAPRRALPMCKVSLNSGVNMVNLYFAGQDIRGFELPGPYRVNVILYDEQGNYIDERIFTTSAYNYIDFQVAPVQVAAISDYGEDTDGDSLFNYLTTELTLDIRQDANYGVEATLLANETFVESISKYLPLEKGLQKIGFFFNGEKIRKCRSNSPYALQVLVSEGDYSDHLEYDTKFYKFSQFQLLDSAFSGGYSDYGVDEDNDGLYDYLVVEADVNTIVPGDYCIIGRLDNSDGNEISSTHYVGELEAGIHTISLEFGALAIFRHQINGPCILDVCIYDQNGVEVDRRENAYTTSSYDYTQFRKPIIEFASRYDDYGVDEDDNGLYGYLIIETDVNVIEPGNYSGVAWLAGNGTVIVKMSGSGYLGDGVQTIDLEFNGASIYERGIQGPYTLLYLALYDENEDLVNYDWNIYETEAYKCTEFEGSGLRGDFNNDYSIDPNDFVWLCSHWLEQECQYPLWCDGTDIDRSGSINFVDYAILADHWLEGVSP